VMLETHIFLEIFNLFFIGTSFIKIPT